MNHYDWFAPPQGWDTTEKEEQIRQAEQNLEQLRLQYPDPGSIFVIYAERRLVRLRGY